MNPIESTTRELAERGAVLQTSNSPTHVYLVGELHWLDAGRLFWFTAHGDRAEDGHILQFDSAHQTADVGVDFVCQGRRVGRLTDIAHAEVDDPEDYRVAFSLWRQVHPCLKPLIDRCRTERETWEHAAAAGSIDL